MPVSAKLRVPVPRRPLLDRPRLSNPFLESAQPRLVLLSAAPGSGKSTLLQQWLAELLCHCADSGRSRARAAWVSLDESDADPIQFLSDVVGALGAVDGDVATGARALLGGGRAHPEDVLAALVEDLDTAPRPTVIALDDLHTITDGAATDALAFLVDNLPPRVTVAATSRADLPMPLARLRARGELVEVGDADLRFSVAEAAAFFRTILGLDLGAAQVEVLASKTEGWAAGLQLAGVSVRVHVADGQEAVDTFIRAFNGTHRFVLDYLVEEVLDAQPADARAFLLSTSVLDRLSGPLCDAVTGKAGGQRQLAALERAHVFLTALSDSGWFRYHPLFAEALLDRLALEQPDAVARLHRRASSWYATQALVDDALRHAVHAGDAGWMADLLECAAPTLRRERRDRRLIAWIDVLPDAVVRQRPLLGTTRAAARISQGDLASAARWLDAAEAACDGTDADPGIPDLPAAVIVARDVARRTVPANIELFRATLAQASGEVAATVRHAEAALQMAEPTDHFVRGAASGFLGLSHWANGALESGIEVFRGAVDHLTAAGNHLDAFGATVVLGAMAVANGHPDEAEHLYRAALACAEDSPAVAAVVGDLHVGLADVLREADRLDAAAAQLALAADLGDSASLPENRFRWFLTRAGLQLAAGEFDAALRDIAEAQRRYRPGFFPDTRPLHAAKARVLIRSGRLAEARHWALQNDVASADPNSFDREDEVLTLARLVAAERRNGQADDRDVDRVLSQTEGVIWAAARADRGGSLVEARMVQALVRQAAGAPALASEALAVALATGFAAGYARLFLDEGAPMRDLLGRVASSDATDAAIAARRLLLAQAGTASLAIPQGQAGALSKRETEVLRLLATDLSGPEIAAQLFVSINTLRTHTKHIFTKLDARTRRAAVSRARDRGLL